MAATREVGRPWGPDLVLSVRGFVGVLWKGNKKETDRNGFRSRWLIQRKSVDIHFYIILYTSIYDIYIYMIYYLLYDWLLVYIYIVFECIWHFARTHHVLLEKNTISHSVVCERKGDVSHFECNSTFVVLRLVYMYIYTHKLNHSVLLIRH